MAFAIPRAQKLNFASTLDQISASFATSGSSLHTGTQVIYTSV